METKIVFISCLKIFMKKLLGKNINHTNSNKKRVEKPDSLVTRSPHKVSTFVQQHGSAGLLVGARAPAAKLTNDFGQGKIFHCWIPCRHFLSVFCFAPAARSRTMLVSFPNKFLSLLLDS